jgi:uncharacterized membrane protein
MSRHAFGLAALVVFTACDSVGPIATLGATRLAWEVKAMGDGWTADIDDPEMTLTIDGYTETMLVVTENTGRGRVYSGAIRGLPFTLLVGPGPCALGLEGAPTRYEFIMTLTVAGEVRSGCGSRPWVIGYKPPPP